MSVSRPPRAGVCPGGEHGGHVDGAPPTERDRPVESGEETLSPVGGAQGVPLGQFAAKPGGPCRVGAGDERLSDWAIAQNSFSARGFPEDRPLPTGRGPP